MNEESTTLRRGKAVWQWIVDNAKAEVGSVLIGLILWNWGGQLWTWLSQGILSHIPQTICVAAILTTMFAVQGWAKWRRIASLEREKALETDSLKQSLKAEIAKNAKLEALVTRQKAPDKLDSQEHRVMTFLLGEGRGTQDEIETEVGVSHGAYKTAVKSLQFDKQFISRIGFKEGNDVFGVTELGEAFAEKAGLHAIKQGSEEIRRSALEQELRQRTNDLAVERLKVATLTAELKESRAMEMSKDPLADYLQSSIKPKVD